MKNFINMALSVALLLGAVAGVHAQEHHHDAAAAAPAPATAPAEMSSGEVVKVDKSAGKITLRHGPLVNLGMSGMTMPFNVAEPAMLEQVKPGNKVQFVAEEPNDTLTIVKMQIAK
jgi:Cu/Ag efflux protein CusF